MFPDLSVDVQIMLNVPVNVPSAMHAERSFSKLKLIKTYLRSCMTPDRPVGLAIMSIENNVTSSVDFSSSITKFASSKVRKVCL